MTSHGVFIENWTLVGTAARDSVALMRSLWKSIEWNSWMGCRSRDPFLHKAISIMTLSSLLCVCKLSSKAYWHVNLCLHCGSLKTTDMNNSFQLVAGCVQRITKSAITKSLNFLVTHGCLEYPHHLFCEHEIASNTYIKPLTIDGNIFLKVLVKLTVRVLTDEDNFYKINMFILNLSKSAVVDSFFFHQSPGVYWIVCLMLYQEHVQIGQKGELCQVTWPQSDGREVLLEGAALKDKGVWVTGRGGEIFCIFKRKLLGLLTILLKELF